METKEVITKHKKKYKTTLKLLQFLIVLIFVFIAALQYKQLNKLINWFLHHS